MISKGSSITVVYKITDPEEWGKASPLNYAHNGLKAYCVSVGDLAARRDAMRDALERIEAEGDMVSRKIARDALAEDDREGDK